MKLQIIPREGVGPVKFGMTQAEVRNVVGSEFESFLKAPTSEMPTDFFVGKGMYIYYRKPGICEAIEMALPANPEFRGYNLMGMPFNQILSYFRQEDPAIEVDDCGLISKQLGIGLYVPELDEGPESPIKGVIVFETGYYD